MKESITTPLRTATPARAMKTTPAEIENGMPRKASAATPPLSARGTQVKTMAAQLQDLTRGYSTPQLRSRTSDTQTQGMPAAGCQCSEARRTERGEGTADGKT